MNTGPSLHPARSRLSKSHLPAFLLVKVPTRRGNKPKKAPIRADRADGDTGATKLRNHYNVAIEPRERNSTGHVTTFGARNLDASPPIDRYFNRGELDKDPVKNDQLYRAAQKVHKSYELSNLRPAGMTSFELSGKSGISDRWQSIKIQAFRDYDRAMKSIDPEYRAIVSYVVVYEAGHARDWALLKRVPERGAIDLLRTGLTQIAKFYGMMKKSVDR
jgi:hypothetical protein